MTDQTPAASSPIVRQLLRDHPWSTTPLGHPEQWPEALTTAFTLCLNVNTPSALYWGEDDLMLYNDGYLPLLGARHVALGRPGREVWGEHWPEIGERHARIRRSGHGETHVNQRFEVEGREQWWTYSVTPFGAALDHAQGVFVTSREATEMVLETRKDRLLARIDAMLIAETDAAAVTEKALTLVAEHFGVQRAGVAELDEGGETVRLRTVYTDGTVGPLNATYPQQRYDAIARDFSQGETVAVGDVLLDPRFGNEQARAALVAVKARGVLFAPFREGRTAEGAVFLHSATTRTWSERDVTLVETVAGRLWQAVKRGRAETVMRESEERYRRVFEEAQDFVFSIGLDRRVVSCNPATGRALGYGADEIVGQPIRRFLASGQVEEEFDFAETRQRERHVVDRAGRVMRWEINSSPARNRNGELIGVHAIARDVTEQRAFEERQQLLIHELNHRVKNTLSLVQSLAHQNFRDDAPRAAEFTGRLTALAQAHDLLTREQWEGAEIGAVVRPALAALDVAERIDLGGPAIVLEPKAAIALTMALHELATNAIKYGALKTEAGRVRLEWRNLDGRLAVTWRERGGPHVQPPASRGFGLRMIERALASDLSGRVTVDFNPLGLECVIDAPLPTERGDDGR